MSTPTPDRIAKLPAWAQDHLHRLTRERDEAVEIMRGSATTTSDSRAPGLHLGVWLGDHELIPLEEVSAARLVLEDGQAFTLRPSGSALEVMHSGRASGSLAVLPSASNVVTLTAVERVQ